MHRACTQLALSRHKCYCSGYDTARRQVAPPGPRPSRAEESRGGGNGGWPLPTPATASQGQHGETFTCAGCLWGRLLGGGGEQNPRASPGLVGAGPQSCQARLSAPICTQHSGVRMCLSGPSSCVWQPPAWTPGLGAMGRAGAVVSLAFPLPCPHRAGWPGPGCGPTAADRHSAQPRNRLQIRRQPRGGRWWGRQVTAAPHSTLQDQQDPGPWPQTQASPDSSRQHPHLSQRQYTRSARRPCLEEKRLTRS